MQIKNIILVEYVLELLKAGIKLSGSPNKYGLIKVNKINIINIIKNPTISLIYKITKFQKTVKSSATLVITSENSGQRLIITQELTSLQHCLNH